MKGNTKSYNKQVMQTGKQANQYLRNALGLLNQYTTDYSGRLDYFTNKLNNRQIDLLSNKYLAENADMLRGSAAFGSNSATDRQIKENAYSQNNYLADVQNKNVQQANAIQQNELSALQNAASGFQGVTALGGNAAANVDAANNSWLAVLGDTASSAGSVLQAIPTPWTQAIGAGLSIAGDQANAIAGKQVDLGKTYNTTQNLVSNVSENWGSGTLANKIKLGSNSNGTDSTLSNAMSKRGVNWSVPGQ